MLLPLYHLPFPFPTKTLDSSQILFFTSQSISSPYPKPLKSVIRSSSTTNTETLSKTAIERIAEKLRSLGYVEDEEKSKQSSQQKISNGSAGEIFLPSSQSLPKQRVGYTIDSSWSTPETVPKPGSGTAITRFRELKSEVKNQKRLEKKREVKVPTLAELTIPQEELRRLRKIGIALRKKLKVGVAGITEGIVNGIHERWRRSEVVKISCEDLCKLNMKRTHDLLERKTGGLVVWRSGSTIIIYRGTNYKFPYFLTDTTTNDTSHDELSSESSMDDGVVGEKESNLVSTDGVKSGLPSPPNTKAGLGLVHGVGSPNKVRFLLPGEAQLAEEADRLLDGLGPRFTDWWGYEPLPIDADLLPAIVPGYRRPFRLLPYGVKPKLTDDEMTTLRRLGHPLPCHFALGRNRNLQGLAASMVKLWEKCEIAKIAVKRGVQNTNSEMMAEELKRLTGGTLLSRDKEFIAFYRGKDFLPPAVSTAIEERRKPRIHREKPSTIQSPSIESRPELESSTKEPTSVGELQEMNDRKDRKPRSTNSVMKSISTKLSMVLQKKEKAEQLLTKLEKEAETQKPEVDRQGITEEERYMLKKVGLRMKPFLLLGRRGVFDGTIENMHLHWKYRELVKIITSARCIEDVHGVAKTLEAESGGILVAVERVNRDYAIIMYRGKNYQRPADLRPRTLLNKRQAMKRSLEAQRCESLKLHVLKLTKNIDELKLQLAKEDTEKNHVPSTEHQRETTQFETRDHLSSVKCSQNEKNAGSVESARSPEATEGHRYDSTSLSSDYLIDDIEEATHLDKLMNYFPKYDEFAKTEVESTHKAVVRETHSDNFQDEVGDIVYDVSFPENVLSQSGGACAVLDKAEVHDSDKESVEPSIEFGDNELNSLVHRDEMEKGLDGVPFRAKPLSNRERLILRKQALKMKKRPVLAVGRSNVVTGVAKAIKTHFQKNPLAIVNVKGRAKGTSIQELVTKLEQATGAVMVSQEPNKVILYRGWGEGDEARGATKDKTNARTVAGRVGGKRNVVSPQLMAAIRLECGLMVSKEERT